MAFGKRTPDKRRAPRDPVRIAVLIEYDSAPPQKCFMINLSKSGALLEVGSILGIPNQFRLRIAGQGCWAVEVVRRSPSKLAVAFV